MFSRPTAQKQLHDLFDLLDFSSPTEVGMCLYF